MNERGRTEIKNQSLSSVTCVFVDNHVAGGVDTFIRLLIPKLSGSSSKMLLMVNQNYPDLSRLRAACESYARIVSYSSVFQGSWFTRVGVTRRSHVVEKLLAAARRLSEYLVLPFEVVRLRRNLPVPPDSSVLVINGGYPGSYAAIAAALAYSKSNVVAMNIHSLAVARTLTSWPIEWIIDWKVRKRVKIFIAVSHTCDKALKIRFSPQSICSTVVYNAAEWTSPQKHDDLLERQPNQDRVVLGLVSTVELRKGHWFAVRLLAHLREALPSRNFILKFVGSDPYHLQSELVDFARSYGVSENIEFSGYLDSKADIYSTVDIVLIPSTSLESFGYVAVEAVVAGRHVVSSSAGALPEILQGLPNCAVLPSLEVLDWSHQIERILPNLRRERLQVFDDFASFPKLQRFLNPDQMAQEYIDIFGSLNA